jgi:uncharacterized protein
MFEFGRPLHELLSKTLAVLDSYKPTSLTDQSEQIESLILAYELTNKSPYLERAQKSVRKILNLQAKEGFWLSEKREADIESTRSIVLSLFRCSRVFQEKALIEAVSNAVSYLETSDKPLNVIQLQGLMHLLTKDIGYLNSVYKTATALKEDEKATAFLLLYLIDGNKTHLEEAAKKLSAPDSQGLEVDLWSLSNFEPAHYPRDITLRKIVSSRMGELNSFHSFKETLAFIQGEVRIRRESPETNVFNEFTPFVNAPLHMIVDNLGECVVIGRSKEDQDKLGDKGTIYIGRICEKSGPVSNFGKKILLDVMQPHKIFISGKTGSGKSYTLGVMVEELARSNIGIGTVIVDPMGTFWSMKYPHRSEREVARIREWDLVPKGYENIKVFVPIGFYDEVPKATRDFPFAIKPGELTGEDWCNTFGINPFESPSGGLLMQAVDEVKKGYQMESDGNTQSVDAKSDYSIDDLVMCAENDSKLVKMYKNDTVRAVKMRLEASKHWGIFSQEGVSLEALSVPYQVSIVDVSQLGDSLRALIVGILARKILEERTRISREYEASKVETEVKKKKSKIPVTWLLVDEAHVLAPSSGRTAASEPLIEYAKRGRMPGCGLVLCTQQPAATDAKILSQLDLLITHTLTFADDIAALQARIPTSMPKEIGDASFIRRIPIGDAIIADHSISTERAFLAAIRPRTSEHAGRAVTPEVELVEKPKPFPQSSEMSPKLAVRLPLPLRDVPVHEIEPKAKEAEKEAGDEMIAPLVAEIGVIENVRKDQYIPIPVFNIEEDLLKKHQLNAVTEKFQEQFKEREDQNVLYGQSYVRKDPTSFLNNIIAILKAEGWLVDKIQNDGEIPVIFVSKGDVHLVFTLAIQKLIFSWFAGTDRKESLMDFGPSIRRLIQKAEEKEKH